jgi:hypothetical protein
VRMQKFLESQQSPDLHPDFLGMWQRPVGMSDLQRKARIATHRIKQRDAQGIAGVRIAGNSLTVSEMEPGGLPAAAASRCDCLFKYTGPLAQCSVGCPVFLLFHQLLHAMKRRKTPQCNRSKSTRFPIP